MPLALYVRTFLMYPAAGAAGMLFGFVDFDQVTGVATIDLNAANAALFTAVSGGGSLATFLLSRLAKRNGGAT